MNLRWKILYTLDWLAGWVKVAVFFGALLLLYMLAQIMAGGELFTFEIEKHGHAQISTNGVDWEPWPDGYEMTNSAYSPTIVGYDERTNSMLLIAGKNVSLTRTTNNTTGKGSFIYMGPNFLKDTNAPPMP